MVIATLPVFFYNLKTDMTAGEKRDLAYFLDMSAAVIGGGYRCGECNRVFEDDAEAPPPNAAVAATAVAEATPTAYAEAADTAAAEAASGDSLERVAADVRACAACRLGGLRTNAVPGEGVSRPVVMVIGEGPGADEDASGRPFVGAAGQLLDKMLGLIGLSRESNCYIANVIKCRPPANRDPQPDERAACAGFLARQIQLLRPRFILCMGRVAGNTLLNTDEPVGRLRGRFIDYQAGNSSIPLIATYHPSALLRNEELKRPAWEDLKMLRAALSEAGFGNG